MKKKPTFAPNYEFPTSETLPSTASPVTKTLHEKTLTSVATHLDAYAKKILEDPEVPAEQRILLAHEALGFAKATAILIATSASGIGQLWAKFLNRIQNRVFGNK